MEEDEESSLRKVIFWDFDGTLTFSRYLWTESVLEALGPLAEEYHVTEKGLWPFLRSGFPWDAGGIPGLTGDDWWADRIRCFRTACQSFGVPAGKAEKAAETAREIILSPGNYRVYPDAAAVLAVSIYKGYQNYLLSNNYPELEEVLEGLYLRQFFTGCIVSGQVGINKPDKKLFDYALQTAHFPDVACMVGDNPIADMQGGKRAGMRTILVHSAPGTVCADANHVVDTLTEALRCL